MHDYKVHTLESAPSASRPALETLREWLGRVPNLAATMAESPPLASGFVAALGAFGGGTFTGGERQVILLASAVYNRCAWAVAFHSTAALREGVPAGDVAALRAGGRPSDARRAALADLVRALYDRRGALGEDELAACARAGLTPAQVLEVIAGLGASMMANFAGNITHPPLEEPFAAQAWEPPAAARGQG